MTCRYDFSSFQTHSGLGLDVAADHGPTETGSVGIEEVACEERIE